MSNKTHRPFNGPSVPMVRPLETVDETLAMLDAIVRFCVNECLPNATACAEAECGPWKLERVAVDRLEDLRLARIETLEPG